MEQKASETCRAIVQLQMNILPSCIMLVLLYILTYDARKPKHKTVSCSVTGSHFGQERVYLFQFLTKNNLLMFSLLVRYKIIMVKYH